MRPPAVLVLVPALGLSLGCQGDCEVSRVIGGSNEQRDAARSAYEMFRAGLQRDELCVREIEFVDAEDVNWPEGATGAWGKIGRRIRISDHLTDSTPSFHAALNHEFCHAWYQQSSMGDRDVWRRSAGSVDGDHPGANPASEAFAQLCEMMALGVETALTTCPGTDVVERLEWVRDITFQEVDIGRVSMLGFDHEAADFEPHLPATGRLWHRGGDVMEVEWSDSTSYSRLPVDLTSSATGFAALEHIAEPDRRIVRRRSLGLDVPGWTSTWSAGSVEQITTLERVDWDGVAFAIVDEEGMQLVEGGCTAGLARVVATASDQWILDLQDGKVEWAAVPRP